MEIPLGGNHLEFTTWLPSLLHFISRITVRTRDGQSYSVPEATGGEALSE